MKNNAQRSWFLAFITSILIAIVWLSLSWNYLPEYNFIPVLDYLVLAAMFGTWMYLGYQAEKKHFFPNPFIDNIPGFGIALMLFGFGFMVYLLYLAFSKLIELI